MLSLVGAIRLPGLGPTVTEVLTAIYHVTKVGAKHSQNSIWPSEAEDRDEEVEARELKAFT